ncbi:hypothetical protein C5167_021651 [Papaver somniferum]|nr:hypothetical protein C5167_021651 [Papaver somniferum]
MGGGKDQHNSSDKGLMSNLGSWISWSCRRTWSLEGIQITLPGIILPNKGDTLRHQVVTPQQEYPPAILQPGGYPLSLPISLEIALCLFLEARQQQIYVLYAIMCWNLNWSSVATQNNGKKIWKRIPVSVCWNVWNEKNARTFNGKKRTVEAIIADSKIGVFH